MDTGEGMCYAECCELCKTDDSQTCTPGANNTLYVNKKKSNKKYVSVNKLKVLPNQAYLLLTE